MGDKAGALSDLKEIAGELADKGRQPEAIEVLREAAKLNPDDDEIREKLLDVYLRRRRLRARARVRDDRRAVPADRRGARGGRAGRRGARHAAPGGALRSRRTPSSRRSWRARSSRAAIWRRPAEYLTVETAGDDPAAAADGRRHPAARRASSTRASTIVRRLLERGPVAPGGDRAARLERRRAAPDAGFRVVELAADAAVAQADWPGAAAALQEFVTRVPNHIPALMRLVEICVDGGLEATMYSAQAQLADAYIARGRGDRGAVHRRGSRRARAVGEGEHRAVPPRAGAARRTGSRRPHRRAAERRVAVHEHRLAFSGDESLFDDAARGGRSRPRRRADAAAGRAAAGGCGREAEAPAKKPKSKPRRRARGRAPFRAERERDRSRQHPRRPRARRPPPHGRAEDVEVDLSIVLDRHRAARAPAPAQRRQPSISTASSAACATQASRRTGLDEAEKEYKRGLALRAAGESTAASRRSRRRRARRSCGSRRRR